MNAYRMIPVEGTNESVGEEGCMINAWTGTLFIFTILFLATSVTAPPSPVTPPLPSARFWESVLKSCISSQETEWRIGFLQVVDARARVCWMWNPIKRNFILCQIFMIHDRIQRWRTKCHGRLCIYTYTVNIYIYICVCVYTHGPSFSCDDVKSGCNAQGTIFKTLVSSRITKQTYTNIYKYIQLLWTICFHTDWPIYWTLNLLNVISCQRMSYHVVMS